MSAEPFESPTAVSEPTKAPEQRPAKQAHPLGPLVSTRPMARPVSGRLVAAGLILACAGLLGLSAWLRPDPRGYGTHEQLGLGPCSFTLYLHLPCPSCGMSTAFAHTVRGQWLRAMYVHPMGWLLCVATMAMILICGWAFWRGRVIELNWYRINAAHVVLVILFLFLGSWAFKIFSGLLDGTWRSS